MHFLCKFLSHHAHERDISGISPMHCSERSEMRIGMLIICCIALASLQIRYAQCLGTQAEAKLESAVQTAEQLTNTVEKMTKTPALNKLISPTQDEQKSKSMVSKAREKVSSFAKDTKEKLLDKDEGVAERVTGALGDAMDGLVGMVSGIQNGDWVEGVQGALGIVSAMAALAGPGIGTLISGVLSAISTFLGMFGGSEPESQESMTKRVVETAIKEFRDKDLKEDIEGLQHVYQSLSISVQQFRESGKLSQSQAEHLYSTVFSDLSIFGKLKTRIGEICEKPDKEKDARNCVDFIKLYADLSIMRQLIFADMASLMAEPGINLPGTSENILHIIRKEQENDVKLLNFLGDPGSNPSKRYAIAIMFGNPVKYEVLLGYLQKLNDEFSYGIWDDNLLICTQKMLKGDCVGFPPGDFDGEYKDLNKKNLNDKMQSLFVPQGGQVTLWEHSNFAGSVSGPFIGPALHGYTGKAVYSSLKYEKAEKTNGGSIRYCESEGLNPESLCDYLAWNERDTDGTTIKLDGYHGIPWAGKIGSLYIPVNRKLYAYTAANKEYGPFHGPQQLDKICRLSGDKNDWASVKVMKDDYDARKMVLMCDGEDLSGNCFRTYDPLPNLKSVLGNCNFESKIKSLKLPGNVELSGFLNANYDIHTAGPYYGPITIGKVDFAGKWKSVNILHGDTNTEAKPASARSLLIETPIIKKIQWKKFVRPDHGIARKASMKKSSTSAVRRLHKNRFSPTESENATVSHSPLHTDNSTVASSATKPDMSGGMVNSTSASTTSGKTQTSVNSLEQGQEISNSTSSLHDVPFTSHSAEHSSEIPAPAAPVPVVADLSIEKSEA